MDAINNLQINLTVNDLKISIESKLDHMIEILPSSAGITIVQNDKTTFIGNNFFTFVSS